MLGYQIGKNSHIGFSIINCKRVIIGDNVSIGHFNLIWRLREFEMGTGSTITMGNWITGANIGQFRLGQYSSLTRFHFLEASGGIYISDNTIVAGRKSHFFTHGISPDILDDIRSITIGEWCYIGSNSSFLPGSSVSDHTFVGMGSVVTKEITQNYVLIAGSPASIRKSLNVKSAYFNRSHLPHAHHK